MSTLLYLEMGGAPPRAPGALANASIDSDYRLEDTGGCRAGHMVDGSRGTRGCVVVRATNPIAYFGNELFSQEAVGATTLAVVRKKG